jgi:hypothetical protein
MSRLPALALWMVCWGCSGTPARVNGPTPGSVYAFPLRAEDLQPGERISTGNHGGGVQSLGKDLNVLRFTAAGWSNLRAGASRDRAARRNEDTLIYDKPFYAMEDGEVVGCWRNAPENPRPDTLHPAREQRLVPIGGNLLLVRHQDGVVAGYAHAIPGSIPAGLCPHDDALLPAAESDFQQWPGAPKVNQQLYVPAGVPPEIPTGADVQRPRVQRGQYLGRVGNSGASSGPHLHVDMTEARGTETVPHLMRFEAGVAVGPRKATAPVDQWISFAGRPLPDGPILVWPAEPARR